MAPGIADKYRRCSHCGGIEGAQQLPLTTKQHAVYSYLFDRIERFGHAPMFSEIAAHFGYNSLASVHEHLDNLERKGWIKRQFNVQQSIECLVAESRPSLKEGSEQ